MATEIWKFPVVGSSAVLMPEGAVILSAGEQDGVICIWAVVNISKPKVERTIEVIGTGWRMDWSARVFIGTVQMLNGLVFHVFDGGEEG